jgi:vacuolar-type H+-ATPase subunit E/Vma4
MKKREALEQLQILLCDTYKDSIDEMRESGDYNAALLNGARQLLKDNDVVSLTEQGTPLGNLAEVLPFDDDAETKQAIRQA